VTTIPFPRPGGITASVQAEMTPPAGVRPQPPHQGERSAAARRPASAVPSIKGLRISPPGFKATLVDISVSGLLAEWGVALKIGQAVTVDFEGTFSPQSLAAHVIRSAVASMTSGGVRYYVGLAFTAPIAFDDKPPPPPETSAEDAAVQAAVADPLQPDDIENCW
jgi:PilZ domain-containing protein